MRSRIPVSVFNRRLAALITPWQVPQIVIISSPSASACANVLALRASAITGSASVTAPAPLPAAAVQLVIGNAKHVMQKQMEAVFKGNPPAVGVLLYESQPAAASGHTLLASTIVGSAFRRTDQRK